MVNSCCVVGCTNRVGKEKGLRFYRFPLGQQERCAKWTAAVRRACWKPTAYTRICNKHFVSGKWFVGYNMYMYDVDGSFQYLATHPTRFYLVFVGKPHDHQSHPDYVPSIFPAAYKKSPAREGQQSRLRILVERGIQQKQRRQEELDKSRQEENDIFRRQIEK